MTRPVSGGMLYAPMLSTCIEAQIKRRPAMKKGSTVAAKQGRNFTQQKLTIGLDLSDRTSWYCVLASATSVQSVSAAPAAAPM